MPPAFRQSRLSDHGLARAAKLQKLRMIAARHSAAKAPRSPCFYTQRKDTFGFQLLRMMGDRRSSDVESFAQGL
jgi:hypothetical protein